MTTNFATWPVDGPRPLPPVHGLLRAAESDAAGVSIILDTADGPADVNTIHPTDAGLEEGLYRNPDGSVWMRQPDGSTSQVWTPMEAGRERWLNGVAVWPYPTDVPGGYDACSDDTKPFGAGITPPEFNALTVVEPVSCTMRQITKNGKPNEEMFRARAVTVLAATESFAVAHELMSGANFASQPYLADTACTFPNGQAATKPNHGLQVLEQAISLTGRLGVIHCSPMLATALLGQGFVIQDKTGVIRTINGYVVIPDGGYVNVSKPVLGVAPTSTEEWAYATGPIDIRRSEIFTTPDTLAQALDRSLGATNHNPNQLTYRAERYYVASLDTALQAAVLIDRCGNNCVVSS